MTLARRGGPGCRFASWAWSEIAIACSVGRLWGMGGKGGGDGDGGNTRVSRGGGTGVAEVGRDGPLRDIAETGRDGTASLASRDSARKAFGVELQVVGVDSANPSASASLRGRTLALDAGRLNVLEDAVVEDGLLDGALGGRLLGAVLSQTPLHSRSVSNMLLAAA